MIIVTVHSAPFAKPPLRGSPLLCSSFLLISWRSLRTFLQTDFHASMKSAHRNVRVNCNIKKEAGKHFLCFSYLFFLTLIRFMFDYLVKSIMISLLLAMNLVMAAGARGACWILARS